MRRWIALGFFVLGIACCSDAQAVPMGVGLRVGTLGFGLEYGVELQRWMGLRGAVYWGDYSDELDYEDNTYDGTLTVGGYGAFVDFYPTKKSFRISAGLLSNRNGFEADGRPTQDQEIGDGTYTPAEIGTLSGEVEFESIAWYAGIGGGRFTGGDRLGFLFDLGVVFQGSGEVSIESTGGGVDPDDIEREEAELEEDIEDYPYWPVISIGMAIRF